MKSYKARIATGVDAKILQYEEHAKTICTDKIDLVDILSEHLFKKDLSQNCILINMEKDVERYTTSVEELKKISLTKFVHLKGTNGKEKKYIQSDLSFILRFLTSTMNPYLLRNLLPIKHGNFIFFLSLKDTIILYTLLPIFILSLIEYLLCV